ncbi:MAG: hypothetical protein IPN36_08110 [Bacteroidetes bacterium]|nr:hypothetical protein [Bacteroidota bacterium]MBL0095545.1 hypothetical protein [Bacteroidota bacterium]
MKKQLFSLIFSLVMILPIGLMAQSDKLVKGKRGGYIVAGEQQVYFEIVDDGSKVNFYPCDINGESLKVMPEIADITIVYIETTKIHYEKDVRIKDGVFSVYPPREYPIYIYGINYTFNDQQGAVKFRAPDAPQPR